MKRFLLVDDHIVVRSGIQGLLSEIFKPCEIHEAGDSESATEKLKHHQYDLIMMDIQMPNSDTMGLMEYIQVRYPDAKVLIFSMSAENIYARRFIKAGAMGFLSKDSSLDEIKKAINMVLNNRKYISESFAEMLADASFAGTPDNPFDKLSPREFEITSLLLTGQSVSEISKTLHLQISTVGTHKSRVFEKLKVTNILELKELANSYKL
ncbi:response regulator [Ferruginibacter sp. SUN106]|uniref:response regulator n=1 Tax=Ferruginibacter sp. SUN106 TaxID=2978348 RepID=UPI003D36E22B